MRHHDSLRDIIPLVKSPRSTLLGSGEFLLLLYEIQRTGSMTEGTVPAPHYRPCAQERPNPKIILHP